VEILPETSPVPPGIPAPSSKRALGLIFFIMLMDIIGITLLAPVAPYIVGKFSDSALMVTMLTILYAAGQFIAAPMLGKLGDRYGRRPVLLLSLFGQGIGYIIFALGGSLWVLFLGRIIGGITGGNLSTAAAYIADVSKPAERAKNFSLIGTAWSMGLILGPAFGGVLGQLHLSAPAYIAAALTFLNVILGLFILPESLPKERRETSPMRVKDFNPIFAIVDMARRPGLGWLLLVTCLFNFAFNGINTTSSIFFIHKFSAQTWHVSLLMMLAGAAIMATNFLLVPRLVPRFGDRRVASASLMGQAVVDIAVFFMPIFWPIFILNMLISAISAFTFPTLTTLSIDRIPHREVGLLMGVTTGLGSLMNIFGPLWAGAVYDGVMPGAPYWMGAVILVVAGLMLLRPKMGQQPAVLLQSETEEK
jgi:MFS transporter, DHA1 family, tetracycline resistance protein